jgi:hypothetical protein
MRNKSIELMMAMAALGMGDFPRRMRIPSLLDVPKKRETEEILIAEAVKRRESNAAKRAANIAKSRANNYA